MLGSIVVFAAAAAVAQPVPFEGTLCFQGSSAPCVATTVAKVDVASADTERDWVWTSADGLRTVLGTLTPKTSTVDLEAKTRSVTFTLSGDAKRGWPADMDVTVGGRTPRWKFSVPANRIPRFRRIDIPDGRWELSFSAPHHFKAGRGIAAERNVSLGPVELRALPVISGRVVRSEEGRLVGVEGAQLLTDAGKQQGVTGANGKFRSELAEPTPREILVIAPGLATVVLPLRNVQPEVDLGEIRMDRGLKLEVSITRPSDDSVGELELELLQTRDMGEELRIGRKPVAAKDSKVTFDDVASGKYLLLVKGKNPLERILYPVTVGAEGAKEEIEIRPYRLKGRVKFGDEPLADVTLNLGYRVWRSPLKADREGRFEDTLWQPGKLNAMISGEQVGSGVFVESPELGTDPSEWNIDIPKRAIEGRVLDADTKQPLAGVRIDVQSVGDGRSGYFPARVQPDGRFVVVATRGGKYDLRISHPERVGVTKSFEFGEEPVVHKLDVFLESGIETTLEFVNAAGAPVLGGAVEGVGAEPHNPARMFSTDREGKIRLRSAPGEERTIYLVGGAFAIARFTAPKWPSDASPLRIVVPPPVGSIRVEVVRPDGEAAPSDIRIRYNGEFLPFPATARLAGFPEGPGLRRFLNLPAGVYEFWASRNARELTTAPSTPPVRVDFTGGEAVARIVVQ